MCPLHKNNPLEMFCIDELKLHCAMCKNEKLHKNHKTVKVSEISKDNEIFSVAEVKELFEDVLRCDGELERKISDTIEGIKSESFAIRDRIAQTYIEAHEKLKIEEVKVMEEVEKACNEAEYALQKDLENLRSIRDYNSALSKVNSMPLGQCSRLMELNIVCEMGKQKAAIEELHKMRMTDLKIDWDAEKRKLVFIRSLINGAPIPFDIVFPVVMSRRIEIEWKCDESKMDENDRNELCYVVEMKKTEDEEWKEVCTSKEKKCSVNGLDMNTEYDIRIKCVIGDLIGGLSDVASIKTKNLSIDSVILSQENNKTRLSEKLCEWCKSGDFELIYRGSRDEFNSNSFHKLCDGKGNTVVLVKNSLGHIFGGFTPIPWGSTSTWKKAPGTFVFTLTNMHGIEPTKFVLKDENDGKAVCHYGSGAGNWILAFGSAIVIDSGCNTNSNSNSGNFPNSFNDTTGKGGSIFSGSEDGNYFKVQEIEVFSVSF